METLICNIKWKKYTSNFSLLHWTQMSTFSATWGTRAACAAEDGQTPILGAEGGRPDELLLILVSNQTICLSDSNPAGSHAQGRLWTRLSWLNKNLFVNKLWSNFICPFWCLSRTKSYLPILYHWTKLVLVLRQCILNISRPDTWIVIEHFENGTIFWYYICS